MSVIITDENPEPEPVESPETAADLARLDERLLNHLTECERMKTDLDSCRSRLETLELQSQSTQESLSNLIAAETADQNPEPEPEPEPELEILPVPEPEPESEPEPENKPRRKNRFWM